MIRPGHHSLNLYFKDVLIYIKGEYFPLVVGRVNGSFDDYPDLDERETFIVSDVDLPGVNNDEIYTYFGYEQPKDFDLELEKEILEHFHNEN